MFRNKVSLLKKSANTDKHEEAIFISRLTHLIDFGPTHGSCTDQQAAIKY